MIISKPTALVSLTLALSLIDSLGNIQVAAESSIANLANHAEAISLGADMIRDSDARQYNYQKQHPPYITRSYDSPSYEYEQSDNRKPKRNRRVGNNRQQWRDEEQTFRNRDSINRDNRRYSGNQQYLKYDGQQYTFHHTFIPDDEPDVHGYQPYMEHDDAQPKQSSKTPSPAAEKDSQTLPINNSWKQSVSSFLRQIFQQSEKKVSPEISNQFEDADQVEFEESIDSSYEMSPDDKFNTMDWSQYEHEVVLRFNWTSSRERAAFINAATTLVLDVWRVDTDSGDVRLHTNRIRNLLRLLPKSLRKPEARSVLIPDLEHAVYNAFPTFKNSINLDEQLQAAMDIRANTESLLKGKSSDAAIKVQESRAVALDLFHTTSELFFQDYRDLNTIYTWLKILRETFPDQVDYEVIGQTHEGRDIVVYHVSASKSHDQEKKKTIVLTSGIHSREWISVSSSLFLLYNILKNKDKPAEQFVLNNLDFLIVPVMNPDGYVYTWEHDRLWRKNRQDTGVAICNGIDIDSSFNYHWRPSVGTPCSEGYAGQAPLEALEALHFSNYINKTSADHQYFGYIDLHSYSQSILYPYGYSCDAETRDQENLLELAYGLAKAIRWTSTKQYKVMPACEDREFDPDDGAGGCVLDFMYKIHAYWAYEIKLRDTGNHGFLLPKKYILPVGKEIYAALRYFCDFILSSR